jgi:hypothetical protein
MTADESFSVRGDFRNQLLHVGRAAQRLLTMQDQDTSSPAFGSFHYPYWRDKTSDFPDARFQEAGAALGLLSLPVFDIWRDREVWPCREALLAAFRAGVDNLARQQYSEGCYDEWYKGERGFAATAFTTTAYGVAAVLLGNHIEAADKNLLIRTLRKAAHWLSQREDKVKTNHEIVGAAALAAVWKITGEEHWRGAAEHKLELSLANRSEEGWFNELGGVDLGYSSLALDYLMIYGWLTHDSRAAPAAARLLELLAPHLHPDLTAAAEAGICRNPYVGQLGFLLLQGHPLAKAIVAKLSSLSDSSKRVRPYLEDDVRLARGAILPIVAALLANRLDSPAFVEGDTCYRPGWTIHKSACLASYHENDLHVYAPIAGGAVTRVYRGDCLILEDLGMYVREGGRVFAARSYDAGRPLSNTDDGISASLGLGKMRYLFPNFRQRLILRLGSMTPLSSRLTRSLIDRYRVAHRTAANQSAASTAKAAQRFTLERKIKIDGDTVRIVDRLSDSKKALSSDAIACEIAVCGAQIRLPAVTFRDVSALRIVKTIRTKQTSPMLQMELTHE